MKNEERNLEKGKLNVTRYLGLGLTAFSIASGIVLHSQTNHLLEKCPFEILYGDKVIEHSIEEAKKHKETNTIKVAPTGYTLDPKTENCVTESRSNLEVTINPETGKLEKKLVAKEDSVEPMAYTYDTYYGWPSEFYGISSSATSTSAEEELETTVRNLYR